MIKLRNDDYELESELQMPIQRDVYSRRILRDVVCLIMQTELVGFSTSVGSFGSFSSWWGTCVRGRRWVSSLSGLCLVWSDTHLQIPNTRYLDFSWLRWWLNPRRNAKTVCGASNTYLDLTSAFFFDEEAKDPTVSVCHICKPAIGILANCAT